MIEAGDFRVSRPSQALERLEAALAQARTSRCGCPRTWRTRWALPPPGSAARSATSCARRSRTTSPLRRRTMPRRRVPRRRRGRPRRARAETLEPGPLAPRRSPRQEIPIARTPMKRALPYLAAAASGAAMALALPLVVPFLSIRQVDPAGWLEPVAWVALVPALLALRAAPSMRAAAPARPRRRARLLLRRHLLGLERDDRVRRPVPRALARRALAARPLHGGALGGGVRGRLDDPRAARLAAVPPPPARVGRLRAVAELPLLRVPVGEPRLHAGADAPGRAARRARGRVRHRGARRARERDARGGHRGAP